MADRISSLPDAVLCYILSFLPTKVAVATNVLSKRWKPLWRSVPALNFNDDDHYYDQNESHKTYSHFVQSVYTFIITRDLDQPLQRFHLRCRSSFCKKANVRSWLIAAAQRRVEHLDLYVHEPIELPSPVLRCKTLVVLKLTRLRVKALPSVDLPSLKILHFKRVEFLERRYLAEFLAGSPNLEDLESKEVYVPSYKTETKFKRLPKLLRAVVVKNGIPLDFLYNVQFLRIDNMVHCEDPIPEFHNLTHIEFGSLVYKYCLLDVLEVLNHCPKLQNISIEKKQLYSVFHLDEGDNWPCPVFLNASHCTLKHAVL